LGLGEGGGEYDLDFIEDNKESVSGLFYLGFLKSSFGFFCLIVGAFVVDYNILETGGVLSFLIP